MAEVAIFLFETNMQIIDSVFQKIGCQNFIYASGNSNSTNSFIILENISFTLMGFQSLIYLGETSLEITNSNFEDNFGTNLLISNTNPGNFHTCTLRNITVARNEFVMYGLAILGGQIDFILDSFEYRDNLNDYYSQAFYIEEISDKNFVCLNDVVFSNNWIG